MQAADRPVDSPGPADEAGLVSAAAERPLLVRQQPYSSNASSSTYGSLTETDDRILVTRSAAMSKAASRKIAEAKASPMANLAVFVFMPWVVFLIVMCPFALGYRHYATFAWFVFAYALVMSVGFRFVDPGEGPNSAWTKLFLANYWRKLSYCCLLAALAGCALGLYTYFRYVVIYHIYEGSRFYANVLPSEVPAGFLDAGMFSFSPDSYVDPTRSAGYTATKRYCAAPIFNRATASTTPHLGKLPKVNFWAVGQDCCQSRGHFECGPIWDETAHSGLRVLDASPLQVEELPTYMIAIREATSTYGLKAPENPVLVKWTKAPQELPKAYWDDGVHFYKKAIGACIGIEMVIALFCALFWESRRVSSDMGRGP